MVAMAAVYAIMRLSEKTAVTVKTCFCIWVLAWISSYVLHVQRCPETFPLCGNSPLIRFCSLNVPVSLCI